MREELFNKDYPILLKHSNYAVIIAPRVENVNKK